MNQLLRIVGVCLMGSASAGYFVSWQAGLATAMFLAGSGLFIDSLRK